MKTAIFIDVQNIYYTTRDTFRRSFNYRLFWKHIETKDKIIKAIAYATDREDENQRKFQHALRSIGFNVKLKPYISRADGSSKGDWDVGIAIDIVSMLDMLDVVILASGDGDFCPLVELIQQKNKRIEVIAFEHNTAMDLQRQVDKFYPVSSELLI